MELGAGELILPHSAKFETQLFAQAHLKHMGTTDKPGVPSSLPYVLMISLSKRMYSAKTW